MMPHGKLRLSFSTCIFIVVLNSFSARFTFAQSYASLPQYPSQQPYWNASGIVQQESGPWGPWTQSSDCSRTCGGGIAYQDRICMDIRADGRYSCIGATRRYFSCNVQECPPGSKEFRSEQCARFNTVPYNGKYYSWLPYYNAEKPCELTCMPNGGSFYARMDRKVIDGTRCRNDGSLDVCVDGQCLPVGCDKILGSRTKEDQCRVCGGDGSSCQVVKGIIDSNDFDVGYNDVLLIPVGATSILIQEVKPSNNYLAIRNAAGDFYLNGKWRIEFSREIRLAGTIFIYERKPQSYLAQETLRARGPTTEPIFIVLLYQEPYLGISYEYSVPASSKGIYPDTYVWITADFEACSQTCGGGMQVRPVRCIRKSDRDIVDDKLCDPALKPDVNSSCNTQPCTASWQIGDWSECSQTCAGGSQFRLVVCHQLIEGNSIIVDEELCQESKPIFMRACNLDKECPDWVIGEWSECDSSCGSGNQTRTVECRSKENDEVMEESLCDLVRKPTDFQNCNLGPCEGVEWIVSDWSGCEGSCSPKMESREAHCANEDGVVFPDDACEASKLPELTRPCAKTEMCEPMWHTSEWTECSVTCGNGVQSRVVFCGVWQDESVIKIEDKNCDPLKKFDEVQNCSSAPCKGTWFTGPWNRCSVPCGGGERTRKILCFHEDTVVDVSQCDPAEEPFDKETCNMASCDEDEIMIFGGCKDSKYGCCPDGITVAGFNYEGCPRMNISSTNNSCEEAEFGCCSDNFTLALGPFKQGCPNASSCNTTKYGCCPDELRTAKGPGYLGCDEEQTDCSNSTYGCCSDGLTTASGPDLEGCLLEDSNCTNSTYGCCLDGLTAASGPNLEGCLLEESNCTNSTYGCCADGLNAASGPNFEGCDDLTTDAGDDLESSGEDCYNLKFGCCPDGLTAASGPMQEGCNDTGNATDCSTSAFGCCDDRATFATGPYKGGCFIDESSGDGDSDLFCQDSVFGCCPDNVTHAKGFDGEGCILDCHNSTYGCCPDNVTIALSKDGEGCMELECINSTFGCCPNNKTLALGPNGEGCTLEDCFNSTWGCCPDNVTSALGPNEEGCELEDCSESLFGCCPDNITSASGPDNEGCFPEDCSNSTFGCCPDNITSASGPENEGCFPEHCTNSTFGCCPDNETSAQGPDNEGCFSEDCTNSTFGCCPDNITSASGPDNEGCIVEDCFNSAFGCCPDNVTFALGPNEDGCHINDTDCVVSLYGCCPDNITIATGPDSDGCSDILIECINTTYGCCPDNVTVATGFDFEGCDNISSCNFSEYGCCPDNETFAIGPDFAGCNITAVSTEPSQILTTTAVPDCVNTTFGCCPDEITVALGPNLEGCCFGLRFGCCPDNKTAALGPNFLGCGCQTYPYGCCPDEITPAQGFNYQGCKCEHFRYGCCQDKVTPATGPHLEGCVCQLMYYGCCPDGITPVINSKGEGCGCDSTRYGCCPDGKTAATSADLSGCPCETLPYGCCPDGYTPARTSDLRDCPCEAQRYGCCLDGRTFAKGPNYEGCPCESTRFGCCLDGKTTAPGPNLQGCSCETTRYGCCADGYTPATGPKYEGCPEVSLPKPVVNTEVCSFPKEAGPCRNFTVKWFFDVAYGSCSRFWYGGCDGNGNVFASQDECESACVNPDGPEACLLPKIVGPCEARIPSWYYDPGSKSCETFNYGGCLGNNNRFVSKLLCEQKCINLQPVTPVDICSLPKDEGSCDGAVIHWFYNKESSRCEQFYYGGCKGNANRFESRRECEKSCLASVVQEKDICKLPQEIGPCFEFRERWYFDYESGQCHRFIYGGCNGNENNFASFYDCQKQCGKDTSTDAPAELEFRTEFCFLSQDPGPCPNTEVNWYYDSNDGVCREFYYGGCKGNRNRFKTRKECEISCFHAQDVCSLAMVKGPCSGSFTQWYFDKDQDECFEFLFSGCQGNANRFNSKEACYLACKNEKLTTLAPRISEDVCTLPQEPGPCLGYYRMWYYDNNDNICKSFVYGGCDGNENRFEKRTECEQLCVKKTSKEPLIVLPDRPRNTNEDVCRLPVEPGPCNEALPRWFYDAVSQNCLPFVYGGCSGNKNRFKTSEICLKFCSGIKAVPGVAQTPYIVPLTPATTETVQCAPSNCASIQCPYGIEESFDVNGCSSCRCSNPCEVVTCPEGSRCAIDIARTSQEGIRTEPVCRRMQKPGVCPSGGRLSSGPRDCQTRCRDDADCRGEHKCCNNGCAFQCMAPADEYLVPATQPAPLAVHMSLATDAPTVGSPIQIDCEIQGPALGVSVTWYHNGIPILEDDNKRILPNNTLFLSKAEISDTGEYRCSATHSNGAASSSSLFLTIKEVPAAPTCIDSPQFNNCELIVKSKYCNNKIYGQYCCASCLKAGQLQNIPAQ
ncbi:papilin-like isoform X2 [Stegodyphus dumicola]|uniref:papilin-like isoform X2 n=1 Tax=Stegodyphus dumicola TaxID=202533 RepID=UPI0015ACC25C|nr:papilin-like isoform X2 [Stegodyphus dumicola]